MSASTATAPRCCWPDNAYVALKIVYRAYVIEKRADIAPEGDRDSLLNNPVVRKAYIGAEQPARLPPRSTDYFNSSLKQIASAVAATATWRARRHWPRRSSDRRRVAVGRRGALWQDVLDGMQHGVAGEMNRSASKCRARNTSSRPCLDDKVQPERKTAINAQRRGAGEQYAGDPRPHRRQLRDADQQRSAEIPGCFLYQRARDHGRGETSSPGASAGLLHPPAVRQVFDGEDWKNPRSPC